jgi:hypothetical protein
MFGGDDGGEHKSSGSQRAVDDHGDGVVSHVLCGGCVVWCGCVSDRTRRTASGSRWSSSSSSTSRASNVSTNTHRVGGRGLSWREG